MLNKIQRKALLALKDELNWFHTYPCPVCGEDNMKYKFLTEIDRHGLEVKCAICKCGLIQLNPRNSQKFYNLFYSKYYKKLYTGRTDPDEGDFKEQYERGKRIHNFLGKPQNKTILEIGCSCGGILKYFKEQNNKILGCDLDKEYIEYGKKKGLNLIESTTEQIKQKVDIIIYSHVLEHIHEPVQELKLAKQLLKDDGIIYIEVPGVKKESNYKLFIKEGIQIAHIYYFTIDTLINVCSLAGLKLQNYNDNIQSTWKPGEAKCENCYELTKNILTKLKNKKTNPKQKIIRHVINPIKKVLRRNKIISSWYYSRK